jgi:hypothetical protein
MDLGSTSSNMLYGRGAGNEMNSVMGSFQGQAPGDRRFGMAAAGAAGAAAAMASSSPSPSPSPSSSSSSSQHLQDVLNSMADVEDDRAGGGGGGDLMDFRPPPMPAMTKYPSSAGGGGGGDAGKKSYPLIDPKTLQYRPQEIVSTTTTTAGGGGAAPAPPISKLAAANDLGMFSNYRRAFEPSNHSFLVPNRQSQGNNNRMAGGFGAGGDSVQVANSAIEKILEKLNYLVHLVEMFQLDKSNYVLEEIILYAYLGIFIIFVCDSFHRIGLKNVAGAAAAAAASRR